MALRNIAAIAALVLVLCSSFHSAEAIDYTVGDDQGWDFGVDYNAWASTKTFHVGDTLVFYYEEELHNVLEVQKSAYDSCDTSNPIQMFGMGNERISLSSAGTRYFICGVPGHCDAGMKVEVTVSAGTSSAPTPTPTTSPSPKSSSSGGDVSAGTSFTFTPAAAAPSPSTETETAPPPTSAGHVSDIGNVLPLLLASLIMSLILA